MDEEEMQKGVRESATVLLLLSERIFHRDRYWVTDKEVGYAMDQGKPLLCIGHDFDFSEKCLAMAESPHLCESCREVKPTFQPYARAIISAIECVSWPSQRDLT